MADAIRILTVGFSQGELRLMGILLGSAASGLPRGFRLVRANEAADVAVVNWSTLNIERTQAFLGERFPGLPLVSVSETGVLGMPGLCVSESQLFRNLAALVYEAVDGVELAARVQPPRYVSWLAQRPAPPIARSERSAPIRSAPLFEEPPPTQVSDAERLSGVQVMLITPSSIPAQDFLAQWRRVGVQIAHAEQLESVIDAESREGQHAILLHTGFPHFGAYKLCRLLAHTHNARLPVILLSEHWLPIERARAAHAGATALWPWPASPDEWSGSLRGLMARPVM